MQNVAISLSTNGRDKVSTSGRGISFRFLPALLENPSLLASVGSAASIWANREGGCAKFANV